MSGRFEDKTTEIGHVSPRGRWFGLRITRPRRRWLSWHNPGRQMHWAQSLRVNERQQGERTNREYFPGDGCQETPTRFPRSGIENQRLLEHVRIDTETCVLVPEL